MPRAITALKPLFESLKNLTTNDRPVTIDALLNKTTHFSNSKVAGFSLFRAHMATGYLPSFLPVPCPVNRMSKSPFNVLRRRKTLLNRPLLHYLTFGSR